MSERLPYEEQLQQQWNDLPLPDENQAWADMKRRLEEEDDDGIIVWWRRGCMLWGLLLLALFGMGWWLLKPQKWFINHSGQEQTIVEKRGDLTQQQKNDRRIDLTNTGEGNKRVNETTVPASSKKENPIQPERKDHTINLTNANDSNKKVNETAGPVSPGKKNELPGVRQQTKRIGQLTVNGKKISTAEKQDNATISRLSVRPTLTSKTSDKINGIKKPIQKPGKDQQIGKRKEEEEKEKKPDQVIVNKSPLVTIDTDSLIKNNNTADIIPADSSLTKKTEPVKKKPTIKESTLATNEAKKDSVKKKNIFFSAGLAMQQLLPVAGQKTVPYNSLGRKGTLADYIPSVYFRLNKKDKWFLQSEFRYGAPQYTKEFVYKQQTKTDTSGTATFITRSSNTLKKTYYHQLPVTFNYFVLPDWSIGGGFSWNKFVSAISDNEVRRLNTATSADSLVSKIITKNKSDSAFAKSYFQAVFESQYRWKRFSFGARYAFGLQPYIKFTLPGGTQQKERSTSLQVFLRYELWKSKDK